MSTNAQRATGLVLKELLEVDYVDEAHIKAFSDALHTDDVSEAPAGDSPVAPRVRKVSALSDFAPINLRVKRRKKKQKSLSERHDWLYFLLRWPLLAFIFLFIALEFGLYVCIRQLVNAKEWVSAWRGKKGQLRKRLRGARNYKEWKEAAAALDNYLQFNDWKRVDEDPYYDYLLVKKVKRSLKSLREKNDARGCLGVLECIRANFAGLESSRLYSETFFGTKDLIESFIDEQEKALKFIRETPDLSLDEKKRFFKHANTNLGITALCLSGGASFGYYHFGVVKAFLDAGLLPRIITGTSAGGLIAALACTRTDEELKVLLVPELATKLTACEEPFSVWIKRALKTGARFDSIQWARKCAFFTRGSMTFKEAYLRTGRVLNISVVPADRHSPTKLLNYITAPDTVIWTALIASAAVPGILNPVVLMQKLKDGSLVPWSWSSKFKDGSLRVDIPVQALNLYFNVTHPIVSQVNPHVHLFFFAPHGSAGKPVAHWKSKGWRGNFLLSAAEQWLKHELTKNFKVIRDLELLPQLLGQDWSSVFLQRFEGVITIWPRTRMWDWFRILSDPDPVELERMIRVGELVTWPKLHMIENRARIEGQIYLGRKAIRQAMAKKSGLSPQGSTPIPPVTGSEVPLSVDSEAEAAFNNGSRQPLRRVQGNSPQELRNLTRRRWASNGTEPGIKQQSSPVSSRPPASLLSRLRTKSFPLIPSPFSRNQKDSDAENAGERWSSDSSFEDDIDDYSRLPAGEV